MTRWIVILMAVLLLMLPAAMAEEATWSVLCQPDSYVSIRGRASTSGSVEGRLYLGDAVTVDKLATDDQGRSWAHCIGLSVEAGSGWVCAGYLAQGEATVYEQGAAGVIKANGRVAARKSIDGERREWLRDGDTATVWGVCGNWAVTDKGYVKAEYLEVAE